MTAPASTQPDRPGIDLVVEDGVALLTLRNPTKLNALTRTMVDDDLPRLCAAVDADEAVRAVVITGSGRGFCSGADRDGHLVELARTGPAGLDRPLGGFVLPLARLIKPVVAAINGTAAGGGLALALVCDLRVAVAGAVFVPSYTPAGLVPDAGLTYLLPRAMGAAATTDFVLADRRLDGPQALAAGLVDEVVDDDRRLLPRAVERARELAAGSPALVRSTKQLLVAEHLQRLEEHIRRESDEQWVRLRERGE